MRIEPATPAAIARAASILKDGGLAAFPTETVYGLGADARNDRAVAAIYAAKGRPRFNPLIVHVRDLAMAMDYAQFSPLARALAERFWPGPLTLVAPRRAGCGLSRLVSAGLDSVAMRVPAGEVAQALIAAAGAPLAAPSANVSGGISPTTAAHVAGSLGERVALILDGGPAVLGLESTVIGFDADGAVLLRPGALPRAAIEAITGPLKAPGSAITAPGQLASHYAPEAPLRLAARDVAADEALIAFGTPVPPGAKAVFQLSAAGDLIEAAANLFAHLRAADKAASRIAVMAVPNHGLGEAINDRLTRAAAPRPRA